ncbi:MAG: energy transducer TonB [Candidatus Omnitrophica bacterium]|nr:energy transducer TonB [Candidatus Omnitrophota bacterium]
MGKNYWNISLFFSFLVHTVIIYFLPSIAMDKIKPINKNNASELKIILEDKVPLQEEKKKVVKNYLKEDILPPPYIDNLVKEVFIDKDTRQIDNSKLVDEHYKNRVLAEVPSVKDLDKNPAYMDYYSMIRERIKVNAYRYYDINDKGKVHLSFILLNNGKLEDIFLTGAEGSRELVNIAFKSVRNSAPFPQFPKELNYPKLQFNISIYFKK